MRYDLIVHTCARHARAQKKKKLPNAYMHANRCVRNYNQGYCWSGEETCGMPPQDAVGAQRSAGLLVGAGSGARLAAENNASPKTDLVTIQSVQQ